MFDYEGITPFGWKMIYYMHSLCAIWVGQFKKIPSWEDGESMAAIFESETELPIFMGAQDCYKYEYKCINGQTQPCPGSLGCLFAKAESDY